MTNRERTPRFGKLTVYSNVIRGDGLVNTKTRRHQAIPQGSLYKAGPVLKLNLALLTLAILFMLGYVFMSNSLTSQKYILDTRKSEFNQISAQAAASGDNGSDGYDLKALTAFAQKSGMVEAKNFGVIWADNNFALSDAKY